MRGTTMLQKKMCNVVHMQVHNCSTCKLVRRDLVMYVHERAAVSPAVHHCMCALSVFVTAMLVHEALESRIYH